MKRERVRVILHGAVQGVGFRPFVYRLATELNLAGWVVNSAQGVFIEVEGSRTVLDLFLMQLERDKPTHASVQSLEFSFLDPVGYETFEIRQSESRGGKSVLILPDIATCVECLGEMADPTNRRYLYPFTNCTNCGPRFSIIDSLPYDRPNTSMKQFDMCPACAREYGDPLDRRFHAQPIACHECGPQLELWNETGKRLATRHEALLAAAAAIRDGRILALKGIGGFQLMVDARNTEAVNKLRERKHREEKPFAVMYPSLATLKRDCCVSEFEERLLCSPEAPIVLLQRNPSICSSKRPNRGGASESANQFSTIAPAVAPHNPCLGIMLPYSPQHHLLLQALDFPVVATSGNLSDEPICTDEHEALERLRGIADAFLVHNRPIVRPMDDSVARVLLGREQVLRRARGYAPLPVHLHRNLPTVLAVGSHLKNTVALSIGNQVFISQHIGDLETQQAHALFVRATADLPRLYEVTPDTIACDLHPEYLSSKFARKLDAPHVDVQHHYAHFLSCMAENELEPPVLGVIWDGTGYGLDGTIWGGEFLLATETGFERVAHFRPFPLPGGDAAIKEPYRSRLGLLFEIFGEESFTDEVPLPLRRMLIKGINTPRTSGVGRLYDAVASLIGLRQRASFEGQPAMELEFAVQSGIDDTYSITACEVVDWEPMILELLVSRTATGVRAAMFHNTLAETVIQVAHRVGEPKVALSGGCFQNRYLTERVVWRLREEGFQPFWHQRVPPNDGGIALGQVLAAARTRSLQKPSTPPEFAMFANA